MADDLTWIPFFEELATELRSWRHRQTELVAFLESLRERGLTITPLMERSAEGERLLVQEIDPFTFVGVINRGIAFEQRVAICRAMKEYFGLEAEVPSGFDGVPLLNNQNSRFLRDVFERGNDDGERFWRLFDLALEPDPLESTAFAEALDDVWKLRGIKSNITMGLFWIRPKEFLSLDGPMLSFLGMSLPSSLDSDLYVETIDDVFKRHSDDTPVSLSLRAWEAAIQDRRSEVNGDDGEEHGMRDPSELAPPFDVIFADREEAEWAFGFVRETLELLGVTGPSDQRYTLSFPAKHHGRYLRLNFGQWLVLDLIASDAGLDGAQVVLNDELVEERQLAFDAKQGPFSNRVSSHGTEGPSWCLYDFPIERIRSMDSALQDVYRESMKQTGHRFANWKATPFRRAHQEVLGEAVFDETLRTRILEEGIETAEEPAPNLWWVNQGRTFDLARETGLLSAPAQGADGRAIHHWRNLAELEVGDVVLHYANGRIAARSEVTAPPVEDDIGKVRPDLPDGKRGYRVEIELELLEPAIELAEIPLEWRAEEPSGGPFDANGNVQQGYIFPLSAGLRERFAWRFPELWGRRVFKIAPGQGAENWDVDMAEGVISIGWNEVGDLTRYRSEDALREAVAAEFDTTPSRVTQLTRELLLFRDLEPGDLVVANNGKSEILAVGRVTEPGYVWREDLELMHHAVTVQWDTSFARRIPMQGAWLRTIVGLEPAEYREIVFGEGEGGIGDDAVGEVDAAEVVELAQPYAAPGFDVIRTTIRDAGMRIAERTLRRYHLSLQTRKFVILAGVSGSGKTWLAQSYAEAVGARHLTVPVAPNWTTNEDLLGFFNPFASSYQDTAFSTFLRRAAAAHRRNPEAPTPFHLILDEMNLARVEYYFATFLSAMETRQRGGRADIRLHADETVPLTPNLYFVGTVNIDETTQGFADKVYDRAQLIELDALRDHVAAHLDGRPFADVLLEVWDAVHDAAPFAFRVIDEVAAYVDAAGELGHPWPEALDEQLLQKVLPKVKGADPGVGAALERLVEIAEANDLTLTARKAGAMLRQFNAHGLTSYF